MCQVVYRDVCLPCKQSHTFYQLITTIIKSLDVIVCPHVDIDERASVIVAVCAWTVCLSFFCVHRRGHTPVKEARRRCGFSSVDVLTVPFFSSSDYPKYRHVSKNVEGIRNRLVQPAPQRSDKGDWRFSIFLGT